MVLHFGFSPEYILEPFSISTLVGEFVVARRVYGGCVVSVGSRETLVDLCELDMVNFDVILEMDWLHSRYAFLDYWTHKIMFRFPNELVIEWEGGFLVTK
ncbi:MAG: hypothetical protein Q8840_00660, partial [Sweet potato little leaf phytoplasma]|nr:hypothetical protein [Sweet potato little leaf phytoplasma]